MGGMEAHAHQLVRSLVDRGHRVTLFAAAGSDAADLVPICDRPYEDVLPWSHWRGSPELGAFQDRAFSRCLDAIATRAFDVVHNNSLHCPLIDRARQANVPMVTSLHVPPFAAQRDVIDRAAGATSQQFTVTSRHQKGLWNRAIHAQMTVVYNGIAVADWPVSDQPDGRLVWSGRITQNKGLREAVAAAVSARVALDIMGPIEEAGYFDAFVAPYLGAFIRYLGHLHGSALRRRISSAQAAIVTPMWDEPFGLVAAEAMACGVPVIAFDRGAMREVLGACGRLVPAGDVDALARAMSSAGSLPRDGCRARMEREFSLDRMIDGYEKAYRAAISGAAAASSSTSTAALLA